MDDGWNRAGDALQRDRERDHEPPRGSVTTERKTDLSVGVTGAYGLPPVTLIVDTGSCHVQDYLTPAQALSLAESLTRHARFAQEAAA